MSLIDKVNYVSAAWRAFDARRAAGEDSGEYRYALRALAHARIRHEMAGAVLEAVADDEIARKEGAR